jgi:stage II sporulation protein R
MKSKLREVKNFVKKIRVQRRALLMFLTVAVTVLFFASLLAVKLAAYSEGINCGLSEHLIRLHVVAESDSEEDQSLKLKVRDAVIDYMEELIRPSQSAEETNRLLEQNMESIKALAEQTVRMAGKDYKVDVVLGEFPFPTKKYGDVALPAGYYRALKIIIGKGEGANWWCVLFPPLCFVDASHGTIPDSVKDELKAALSKEEYNIVVSAESAEQIPVRVKFKIVEFFQDTRIKISGLVGRIFNGQ